MPVESKAQKRFMHVVELCKEKGYCPSDKIKKAADSMSMKSIKDFTRSSSEGLPEKVKENNFYSFAKYVELKILKDHVG